MISLVFSWYLKTKIEADKASKYDEMTQAYHRQYGLQKAEELYRHAMKSKQSLGLIFCDINGLKYINDTYGHEAGDTLIRSMSQTIQNEIRWEQHCFINESLLRYVSRFKGKGRSRDYDLFIRLGGDEFLLLFKDVTKQDLENVWLRIEKGLDKKQVKGVPVSASKGLVVITEEIGMSLEEGINLADEAMYKDKSSHYLARN